MIPPIRTMRCGYFGAGPILISVLLAATLTTICWSSLEWHQKYPDLVVGAISWTNADKGRDTRALALFLTTTIICALGIASLCRWVVPSGPESESGKSLNELLLISLIPAAWRLAMACAIPSERLPPLRAMSEIPLAAIFVVAALGKYRNQLSARHVLVCAGAALLAGLFAVFDGLAAVTTLCRLVPGAAESLAARVAFFPSIGVGIAILVIACVFAISSDIEILQTRLLRALLVFQLPLPLLFFYLVPPPLIDPQHRFANTYPLLLVCTIGMGCALSVLFILRRYLSVEQVDAFPLVRVVSPIAVAAMAVYCLCGSAWLPLPFSDYFHWGEQVLPWQQWWDFGKRPYVDFVPIHGLMAYMRGALAQFFFDGTVAAYSPADVLLGGLAAIAIALAASAVITPLGALLILLAPLPMIDRMYFFAPGLLLIASPKLLRRPARWLCAWLVLSLLLVAYNGALGPAFVLGTIPVGIWVIVRLYREDRCNLKWIAGAVALIVIVALSLKISREIVFGFIRFIWDNQWTNDVANSIAWVQGAGHRDGVAGVASSQLLWESFRFAWIAIALGAAGLFWREICRESGRRRAQVLVLTASIPLVVLWSTPWVMGRLDPASLGRPGVFAETAIFFLLPALVLLVIPRARLAPALLVTVMVMGVSYPSVLTPQLDPAPLLGKPATLRMVPAGMEIADGAKIGMPRLGQVLVSTPNILSDIQDLRKTLLTLLRPGETYLDLSYSSGLYYYLDMPCPVRYAAYVAANRRLQRGMLEQLRKNPVGVVMIAPAVLFDSTPPGLRCYRLYREYVPKFAAIKRGTFSFLVDPNRVPEAGPIGSESQLKLLDEVYRRQNLKRLPVAWGQSWSVLKQQFVHVADVNLKRDVLVHELGADEFGHLYVGGTDLYEQFPIPPAVSDGTRADYLRLKFDYVPNDSKATKDALRNPPKWGATWPEPQLAVQWITKDQHISDPIEFNGNSGQLLIPLGAYPRWLLGKGPTALRISFKNCTWARWVQISEVEFLRLQN